MAAKHPIGPRGGTTTISKKGFIRKTLWLHEAENEALRRDAFDTRRSESDIVRELLRQHYGIEYADEAEKDS